MNHNRTPTVEQLIAYAAGDLPVGQRADIEAAMRNDPAAARVVNAWRAAHVIVATDDSVDPPAAALARAKAIFTSRAAATPSLAGTMSAWMNAVDRFVARVIYDSRVQPATVRFADPGDRITLTCETDDGEIDLHAERQPGAPGDASRWLIMGQITADAAPDRDVAIVDVQTREVIAQGTADSHGEFSMEVAGGEREILIRRGESAIVLGPVTLA